MMLHLIINSRLHVQLLLVKEIPCILNVVLLFKGMLLNSFFRLLFIRFQRTALLKEITHFALGHRLFVHHLFDGLNDRGFLRLVNLAALAALAAKRQL